MMENNESVQIEHLVTDLNNLDHILHIFFGYTSLKSIFWGPKRLSTALRSSLLTVYSVDTTQYIIYFHL